MIYYILEKMPTKLSSLKKDKSGMVLFLVMAIALIMGLMMPVYFSFSQQVSFSSFAQLNQDRLSSLTTLAHTSILTYFRDQASEGESPNKLSEFIMKSLISNSAQSMEGWEKETELSDVIELAIPEVVSVDSFKYKITTKIMDQTLKNANDQPYYNGGKYAEGLGTLEVILDASLYKGKKLLASCKHTRRYDLKNICIVASDEDQYSMGFPLKYALLVRDALQESKEISTVTSYAKTDNPITLINNGDVFLNGLTCALTSKGTYLEPNGPLQQFYSFESKMIRVDEPGGTGFRPFRTSTLIAANFLNEKTFNESGIYNKKSGELYLPGLVKISKSRLVLKKPTNANKITVYGKGGLLVPNGITIECGIELKDKNRDLCVLYSRSNGIKIGTSDKIEAAILCFHDNLKSSIKSSVPINIYGCLGVDRLFRYNKNLQYNIEYDKRFKASDDSKEIYSLAILPWIKLEHKQFSRKDFLQ